MADSPDDIAREIVARKNERRLYATENLSGIDPQADNLLTEAIAAAIKAERERCAAIADAMFDHFTERHREAVEADDKPIYEAMSIGMASASRIAASIRREGAMTLEDRLQKWREQPGAFVSDAERRFIEDMRKAAAAGVGYGCMQQIIEWEWQSRACCAFGPEYFGKRIDELEQELAKIALNEQKPPAPA